MTLSTLLEQGLPLTLHFTCVVFLACLSNGSMRSQISVTSFSLFNTHSIFSFQLLGEENKVGKSLKLSQHQRALPIIMQPWFKAKWQSIIELSGTAYSLFTEFKHTAEGVKRVQVFIYSSKEGGINALCTSGIEELSACVLPPTSASAEWKQGIALARCGKDRPTCMRLLSWRQKNEEEIKVSC